MIRSHYAPMNGDLARFRSHYAWNKWLTMTDDEREPLMPHVARLMKIEHMGEQSAVELLHNLGTFLNQNERTK